MPSLELTIVAAALLALLAVVMLAVLRPQWLLPVLVVVGVVTSRPTFIGERYPVVGPVLILAVAAAYFLHTALGRRETKAPVAPVIVLGLTVLWLLIHASAVPGAEPNLVSVAQTVFFPTLAFYFIARDREILERVQAVLLWVILAVATLAVGAVALGAIIGFGRIHVATLPVGYGYLDSALLFPGAFSYGPNVGAEIPRMLLLGREPGMGAIFAAYAFFTLPETAKRRNLKRIVLLAAILTTQSTAGIGILAACWLFQLVLGQRKRAVFVTLVGLAAGVTALYVALFNQTFGYLAKITSTGASFSDRTRSTNAGIEAFFGTPFVPPTNVPLSNINLIASAQSSGWPYVVLAGLFLLLPILRGGLKSPHTYSALFIILVMLTSQPLAGSTAVFMLTMMNFYLARAATPVSEDVNATPVAPGRAKLPPHRLRGDGEGAVIAAGSSR